MVEEFTIDYVEESRLIPWRSLRVALSGLTKNRTAQHAHLICCPMMSLLLSPKRPLLSIVEGEKLGQPFRYES